MMMGGISHASGLFKDSKVRTKKNNPALIRLPFIPGDLLSQPIHKVIRTIHIHFKVIHTAPRHPNGKLRQFPR